MSNKNIFFFKFLEERGYKKHDNKLYSKGYMVFNIIAGGRYISMLDTNPEHKQDKIGICKTPCNSLESNILFDLFEIERKEVGTKAWKMNKNESKKNEND